MKKEVYIKSKEVELKLNGLLSDYQVYYQNLRAFHWLIKGPQFYHLHEKFEDLYNAANDDIDEIAERILMIGGLPLHTHADYLETASLKPEKDLRSAEEILPVLVSNMEHLLAEMRPIVRMAAEADDEGTVAMLSEFIGKTEKELWMLSSMKI